jgi:voltage-gated potassium channel
MARELVFGRRRVRMASAWLVPALLSSVLVVVVSAAAAAAIETHTVSSFGRGLWWATGLVTTVGFIGEPPETNAGEILSALLMVFGFLLLAMVSASLAALFVRQEEQPFEDAETRTDQQILDRLALIEQRLASIENQLGQHPGTPGPGRSDTT